MDKIKVLDLVDRKELINFIRDLIRIPSHKGVEDRERKIAEFLVKWLSKNGVKGKLQKVVENRYNVIATIKGIGKGPSLLFNGHMDTVQPFGMKDPYSAEVKDGRIWGRGTADMKSGLGAMAYALITIQRSGIRLKGDLIFAGVIGEENISEGTQYLVKHGPIADMAIVGEPTSLKVAAAHKGIQWIEVIVKGKSAHASVPYEGINAIVNTAKIICALEANLNPKLLNPKRKHKLVGFPTLNIGKISGGARANTVPELCKVLIDRRWVPGENLESIMGEIKEEIKKLQNKYPKFKVEVNPIPASANNVKQLTMEIPTRTPMEIPVNHRIVTSLRKAVKYVTGKDPGTVGIPCWTDASLLVNVAKIPTAVFGPGNLAQAHANDEFVCINDIITSAKVYILTAVDICGNGVYEGYIKNKGGR